MAQHQQCRAPNSGIHSDAFKYRQLCPLHSYLPRVIHFHIFYFSDTSQQPARSVVWLVPFYKWGNERSERFLGLCKIIQLVKFRDRLQPRVCWCQLVNSFCPTLLFFLFCDQRVVQTAFLNTPRNEVYIYHSNKLGEIVENNKKPRSFFPDIWFFSIWKDRNIAIIIKIFWQMCSIFWFMPP